MTERLKELEKKFKMFEGLLSLSKQNEKLQNQTVDYWTPRITELEKKFESIINDYETIECPNNKKISELKEHITHESKCRIGNRGDIITIKNVLSKLEEYTLKQIDCTQNLCDYNRSSINILHDVLQEVMKSYLNHVALCHKDLVVVGSENWLKKLEGDNPFEIDFDYSKNLKESEKVRSTAHTEDTIELQTDPEWKKIKQEYFKTDSAIASLYTLKEIYDKRKEGEKSMSDTSSINHPKDVQDGTLKIDSKTSCPICHDSGKLDDVGSIVGCYKCGKDWRVKEKPSYVWKCDFCGKEYTFGSGQIMGVKFKCDQCREKPSKKDIERLDKKMNDTINDPDLPKKVKEYKKKYGQIPEENLRKRFDSKPSSSLADALRNSDEISKKADVQLKKYQDSKTSSHKHNFISKNGIYYCTQCNKTINESWAEKDYNLLVEKEKSDREKIYDPGENNYGRGNFSDFYKGWEDFNNEKTKEKTSKPIRPLKDMIDPYLKSLQPHREYDEVDKACDFLLKCGGFTNNNGKEYKLVVKDELRKWIWDLKHEMSRQSIIIKIEKYLSDD